MNNSECHSYDEDVINIKKALSLNEALGNSFFNEERWIDDIGGALSRNFGPALQVKVYNSKEKNTASQLKLHRSGVSLKNNKSKESTFLGHFSRTCYQISSLLKCVAFFLLVICYYRCDTP